MCAPGPQRIVPGGGAMVCWIPGGVSFCPTKAL